MSRRTRLIALAVAACLGVSGCGDDTGSGGGAGSGGQSGDASVSSLGDAPPREVCDDDSHCDDGLFCNGTELCMPSDDGANGSGCVAGEAPCESLQVCDDVADACVTLCDAEPDADGDGHDALACGGDDCDDSDGDRFPGNPEVCDPDGHDEDCDFATYGPRDHDGDGEDDIACCNVDGAGELHCGSDCDDFHRNVHGTATEECDGFDNDCDGETDEGVLVFGYADLDYDLHGDPFTPQTACPGQSAFAVEGDDCDDGNPARHGAMVEFCDGIDNDCDGTVDEEKQSVRWYPDGDGDGFGDGRATPVESCEPVDDHVVLATDCDDSRGGVNPSAAEVCDDVDNDCDFRLDEGVLSTGFVDADGDGFGDASRPETGCADAPGFAVQADDCDDSRLDRYPNRPESCDQIDNDCDAIIDEGVLLVGFVDADRDLHGDPNREVTLCANSPGFAMLGDDCDDDNPARHPAQAEFCDGIDNDCDDVTDEQTGAVTWYRDIDNDGYGDPRGETVADCRRPEGYSLLPLDCDDAHAGINPGSPELCDALDNDCNGAADYLIGPGNAEDDDRDGAPDLACPGVGNDCNDWQPDQRPGAPELCDGVDNDCDDLTDETLDAITWFVDADGDDFGDALGAQVVACSEVSGFSATPGDCDDADPDFSPIARDLCDGLDNDCDGVLDEDALHLAYYPDQDGDGYSGGVAVLACAPPPEHTDLPSDCAPLDPGRHPGVGETCNGIDEDCDGTVDEGTQLSGFADLDGDLRGDPDSPILACIGSAGFSQSSDDCDDADPSVNGTQSEICDEIDNDCDDVVDENKASTDWYLDADGDGYGTALSSSMSSCDPLPGYSLLDNDCNDGDGAIFPASRELCDGVDNDCDGRADEGLQGINPEVCDGDIDDDCDGAVDEGCECTSGDGRRCDTGSPGRCADGIQVCSDLGRWSICQERVEPVAETCNGFDDDCDALTDEGLGCP